MIILYFLLLVIIYNAKSEISKTKKSESQIDQLTLQNILSNIDSSNNEIFILNKNNYNNPIDIGMSFKSIYDQAPDDGNVEYIRGKIKALAAPKFKNLSRGGVYKQNFNGALGNFFTSSKLGDLISIVTHNPILLDYIIQLITTPAGTSITHYLKILCNMMKDDNLFIFINDTLKNYRGLLDVLTIIIPGFNDKENEKYSIIKYTKDNINRLGQFYLNIMKKYDEPPLFIDYICQFAAKNKDITEEFKKFLQTEDLISLVTELLKNYTTFIRILFEVILNDKELFNTTFNINY